MKTNSSNLRQYAAIAGIALSGVGAIGTSTPVSALTFTFNAAKDTSQDAIAGFKAAGDLWSAQLTNNVNVNIDINFATLGTNILAQAGSVRNFYDYGNVYTALRNGQTSTDDNAAVASLSSSSFNVYLNRNTNNPNGSGSATPYLDANRDANNTIINMSNANAKALGLINGAPAGIMTNILTATANNGVLVGPNITTVAGTTTLINQIVPQNSATANATSYPDPNRDASIAFSTNYTYTFDFNRTGTIAAGTFDFVGLAAHEIGHVLGFTSGVDILEANAGRFTDAGLPYVNTLDLFRYSTESQKLGAIDWTADTRDKYFSLDGGINKVAFATGLTYGDGQQASHWKDNLGLGVMDPTAAPGEKLAISENDLKAFDVIGWNRASINATAVPEPADLYLCSVYSRLGTQAQKEAI
jgi:hypothetical protein